MSKLLVKGSWESNTAPQDISVFFPILSGEVLDFNTIHNCIFAETEDCYYFIPFEYDGKKYIDNLGMRALISVQKKYWNASRVYYVEEEKSYYIFGLSQKGKQLYIQILKVDLLKYDIDFVYDMRKNAEVWAREEAKNNFYGMPRVLSILEAEKENIMDGTPLDEDFNLAVNKKIKSFCVAYNTDLKRFVLAFIIYSGTKANTMQLYEYTFKPKDVEHTVKASLYR